MLKRASISNDTKRGSISSDTKRESISIDAPKEIADDLIEFRCYSGICWNLPKPEGAEKLDLPKEIPSCFEQSASSRAAYHLLIESITKAKYDLEQFEDFIKCLKESNEKYIEEILIRINISIERLMNKINKEKNELTDQLLNIKKHNDNFVTESLETKAYFVKFISEQENLLENNEIKMDEFFDYFAKFKKQYEFFRGKIEALRMSKFYENCYFQQFDVDSIPLNLIGKLHSITLETEIQKSIEHVSSSESPKSEQHLDEMDEQTLRKVKYIMNRLTPSNLRHLSIEFNEIKIENESLLEKVIEFIFEKVVNEHLYIEVYSYLLRDYAHEIMSYGDLYSDNLKFFDLLKIKCFKEFMADIQYISSLDEDKIKNRTGEEEFELAKFKRRYIGNLLFVSNLFKLDLIFLKEIENYISILLNESKDLVKEGLYRLFKDCCDNLQRLKGNMDFEKLFKRIEETFEKSCDKARLRFMLLDLLDMKKNNWLPSKPELKPFKIYSITPSLG